MNLINFDALENDITHITLDQAKKEVKREMKVRRTAFQRWAKAQPSKADKYRQQYRALAALSAILETMTEAQWQRRMTAAHGQDTLF